MAIYLDTNVICRWRTFGELDRLALSIIADQIDQAIVIPEFVVVEACAHYERELQSAIEQFDRAEEQLSELFDLEYVHVEPQPDSDLWVTKWRERLEEMCEVTPTKASDAVLALEYEVRGRAPARERVPGKPGIGARDAAIWLAILGDHNERGEPGHFLTKNTKDFFDGADLKPTLQQDLTGFEHPMEVHEGIEGLLEKLGTSPQTASVSPEVVTRDAFEAVQHGLADSLIVPKVVFSSLANHRFRTAIKEGKAQKVLRAQRFARDDESVLMVDAEWALTADCLYQEVPTEDESRWGVLPDLELLGRLQVYIPDADDSPSRGQLIAAQLTASKSADFTENGGLWVFG